MNSYGNGIMTILKLNLFGSNEINADERKDNREARGINNTDCMRCHICLSK